MSAPVRQLIAYFDSLAEAEKREAAAEILRRLPDDGDLPEATLEALADELFESLDAEEAVHASDP